jgi:hypothetical protein
MNAILKIGFFKVILDWEFLFLNKISSFEFIYITASTIFKEYISKVYPEYLYVLHCNYWKNCIYLQILQVSFDCHYVLIKIKTLVHLTIESEF